MGHWVECGEAGVAQRTGALELAAHQMA